ncbi:6-phosphogluconolactonase [Gallibacterium salpingitidis]|uniref:6-phosphogluconolactonase n=1 Tax=Gallibacterium salpingitidis TaxID=505341 RepID=A0A1A7NX33_9PAST|nr:6-phosphogluconolactonase [Gallibacterium salpingitidis]OBW94145.1 6-phosphogluconolactonase [Gallibacterium salpingitidis]
MNYQIFATAQAAVEHIAAEFKRYSELGYPVHISLSGGSTPKLLFQTLAKAPYNTEIQWQNLHFWWGDERCVPPTDPESNYGEVQRLLFDHIAIPAANIHRIYGEETPEVALTRFTADLKQIQNVANNLPVFDWIILGMGTDGHTASLFPHHTNFIDPNLAVIAQHPESGQYRISKTARLIENAKRITYLVTGESKAKILKEIQSTAAEQLPYPAAKIVSKQGATEWYLDQQAAALLR